jgi:hypothetical protein
MTKLPSFARATGAEGTSPLILKLPSLASILSAVPPTASGTLAPTPLATPAFRLIDESVYFELSDVTGKVCNGSLVPEAWVTPLAPIGRIGIFPVRET